MADAVASDDLHGIAASLGELRIDPRNPEPIRDICPQPRAEAKPNTLSSRYGMGQFPFHTDVAHWPLPARFVILYCQQPGSGARPTLLLDSWSWDLDEAQERALTREIWKSGHFAPRLCTIGTRVGNRLSIRFDEGCMMPMTPAASDVRYCVRSRISRSTPTYVHWASGKLLVMDNHRILHARGSAQRADTDRILKRILVGGSL